MQGVFTVIEKHSDTKYTASKLIVSQEILTIPPAGTMSDEYKRYMSEEWGFEKRGDVALFEKLTLEGAQANYWTKSCRIRETLQIVLCAGPACNCAL